MDKKTEKEISQKQKVIPVITTMTIPNSGTRFEVRKRVTNIFDLEPAGTLEKRWSYKYFVETLSDGKRVYLQRPANLHYGDDFRICVEGANYASDDKQARNYPKHDEVREDLLKKQTENPELYAAYYITLEKIFKCQDVSDEELASFPFKSGWPADHAARILKWMFIEQDIRYWSFTGRWKTWMEVVPVPVSSTSQDVVR